MNWVEMIDGTGDSALWLTAGEGEEMEDGSYMFLGPHDSHAGLY